MLKTLVLIAVFAAVTWHVAAPAPSRAACVTPASSQSERLAGSYGRACYSATPAANAFANR